MVALGNLSWWYVDALNFMVFCDVGVVGGLLFVGKTNMHKM